ncbi:MAG: translation initiation factor [Patescibacteria group bacterium]|nr:translation initiation factor [Patescibacteria group bacterium]
MSKDSQKNLIERPPVVAVMGHVDHGKSTLLDYIRKSNVVAGEAGGITQHISAYEVVHKNAEGVLKKITFLDTPGHAAFSSMRERGAKAADVAILIVAADDGVNKQTVEAYKSIAESKTPFLVAINKIDKNGADVQKTKNSLVEAGIYIEGYGGNISCVEISAKAGTGIDELLETILLTAELEELKGDLGKPATGLVIESDMDEKRGISASLVIKDGVLRRGMYVVAEDSIAATKIFEDSHGKSIDEAQFSSPIRITGFSSSLKVLGLTKVPRIGETFYSFESKKEAEKFIEEMKDLKTEDVDDLNHVRENMIPLILKTDVAGTGEAIEKELRKIVCDDTCFKIVRKGVGDITESDLTFANADKGVIIIGFNVKVERTAMDANEQIGATIKTFNIIYELTDWLNKEFEKRKPKKDVYEIKARVKVLKFFSRTKNTQLVGGRVLEGAVKVGDVVRVMRDEIEIMRAKVEGLQQNRSEVKEVKEGLEFGCIIDAKIDLAPGDIIESFEVTVK